MRFLAISLLILLAPACVDDIVEDAVGTTACEIEFQRGYDDAVEDAKSFRDCGSDPVLECTTEPEKDCYECGYAEGWLAADPC